MKLWIMAVMLAMAGLSSCALRPAGAFTLKEVPKAPDYSDPAVWAALPFREDSADVVPDTALMDRQESAAVDVFYIYPTTYTGRKGQKSWNGDVYDPSLNQRTDKSAIRNQATVFNGSCKVYAPRYRQAHLHCFYTKRRKDDALRALQLAYHDVREAFQYYLRHYNKNRPLIIAAHSQGTWHAARLIREFYDNDTTTAGLPPLIVAYLIGMPVEKDYFENLPPCKTATDIHCFCSWRTVHEKYRPNRVYPVGENYAVTNPLTWTPEQKGASRELHSGAVLMHFYEGLFPQLVDAYVDNGLLRISRPRVPGIPVLLTKNYHIADYNFFYANIRENVADRIEAYLQWTNHEAGK